MDLLDFEQTELYFDEPLVSEAAQLVEMAAVNYGNDEAELMLLRANLVAPQHLQVLVALYRYYFYQHRLDDALLVAESALAVTAKRLDFPAAWSFLREANIVAGVIRSMGLVRFYLLALKATAYIHLRLGNFVTGVTMLEKLVELDAHDRIGAAALLAIAQDYQAEHFELKGAAHG